MYTVERDALKHQKTFIDSDAEFPALVAGFGCVHPHTKVHTEYGLMRICDITFPVRVLSWDEKSQKCVLSPSGGSFPKGIDYLYRVQEGQAVFESSGHHRFFSCEGKYQQVSEVAGSFSNGNHSDETTPLRLLDSTSELYRLLLHGDGQHYTQSDVDSLEHYASEARQYGQQLLSAEGISLTSLPSQDGVHKSTLFRGLFSALHTGGRLGRLLRHSRLCQYAARICTDGFFRLLERHPLVSASRISTLPLEHISASRSAFVQFLLMTLPRHIALKLQKLAGFSLSVTSEPPSKSVGVAVSRNIMVSRKERKEPYYDMQVLGTNNYICEGGFIHHNSGKTEAGVQRALNMKFKYPLLDIAYYLPSYDLIDDIVIPRFELYLKAARLRFSLNKTKRVFTIPAKGRIIMRSLQNPERIIGYEVADSIVDELDTLPIHKAKEAWNKIIARNRQPKPDGKPNTIGAVTTPEGFRFIYETWENNGTKEEREAKGYVLYRASTYDNPFLPKSYITNLENTYDENLIGAYLRGEFVNLIGKRVYTNYDRRRCDTDNLQKEGQELHIGMDFNVGEMSAIVHIIEKGVPYAVDEIVGALDTPEMCSLIRERYPEDIHPTVYVYPDASGGSRKTQNASESDISLLEQAGFYVDAPDANPPVKDRVVAVNHALLSDNETKYFINVNKCPEYVRALEQQVYNKAGAPDKTSGLDHCVDAGGYFIHRRYPVAGVAFGRIKSKW